MHPRERQLVGKRAVAGYIKASAYVLDFDVMHIENLRKMRDYGFQFLLQERSTSSNWSMNGPTVRKDE